MSEMLQKFSIKDKYFSDLSEKKIGRSSFIFRIISSVVVATLFWFIYSMIIKYTLPLLSNPDDISGLGTRIRGFFIVTSISFLVLLIPLLYTIPILVRKRSHDFNQSGIILFWIIRGSILGNILYWVYMIFLNIVGNPLTVTVVKLMGQLLSVVKFLSGIGFIISILIIFYLSIHPGLNNTQTTDTIK